MKYIPFIALFISLNGFAQKPIPAAASNVWWITINDSVFTYNLRRIGSDRLFTVSFNLKQPIETPLAPWGWKD